MKINNYKKVVTGILISSAGLINFSLIPNSKIQLTILIVATLFMLHLKLFKARLKIEKRDIIFILFISSSIIPSIIYSNGITIKSLSQPIFLLIYFILYKLLQAWFSSCKSDTVNLFETIFKINTYVIFFSLLFFCIGFINPSLSRISVELFNNANTFDLGGIAVGSGDWLPRLSGFSPEPSFWSLYIVLNIAIFMDVYKKIKINGFYLIINLLSLVVTFGRTGYFVFAILFLYYIMKNSLILRIVIILFFVGVIVNLKLLANFELDASIVQRLDSLFFSYFLWEQSVYLGYGFGNFEYYSQLFQKDYRDVFSLWFNLLFSGGILSITLLLAYLITFYRYGKSNYLLFSIMLGWCVMPAFNLPFIWMYLAIISIKLEKNTYQQGAYETITSKV